MDERPVVHCAEPGHRDLFVAGSDRRAIDRTGLEHPVVGRQCEWRLPSLRRQPPQRDVANLRGGSIAVRHQHIFAAEGHVRLTAIAGQGVEFFGCAPLTIRAEERITQTHAERLAG